MQLVVVQFVNIDPVDVREAPEPRLLAFGEALGVTSQPSQAFLAAERTAHDRQGVTISEPL